MKNARLILRFSLLLTIISCAKGTSANMQAGQVAGYNQIHLEEQPQLSVNDRSPGDSFDKGQEVGDSSSSGLSYDLSDKSIDSIPRGNTYETEVTISPLQTMTLANSVTSERSRLVSRHSQPSQVGKPRITATDEGHKYASMNEADLNFKKGVPGVSSTIRTEGYSFSPGNIMDGLQAHEHGDVFKCGPCNCTNLKKFIKAECIDVELEDIPESLPSGIVSIDISYNLLSYLNHTTLQENYPNLTTLVLNGDDALTQLANSTTSVNVSSLRIMNLAYNQISTVEDNSFRCFPLLMNLSLKHNLLKGIGNHTFKGLGNLRSLDLSKNNIAFIEFGAFDHFPKLKTLNLTINHRFALTKRFFPPRLFDNLPALKNLLVYGSKTSTQTYPSITLANIKNLEWLVINGVNDPEPLGPELKVIKHLHHIGFGANGGDCQIKNISASYFINVPYLTSVTFYKCHKLHRIHDEAYRSLPFLEKLVIMFARGYQLTDAFNDIKGLQNSSLQSLTLNGIVQHAYPCVFLTGEEAKYIQNLQLKVLDLSYNHLALLSNDFNSMLPPTLHKLVLRNNAFSLVGWLLNRVTNLKELEYVDMSNQNMEMRHENTEEDTSISDESLKCRCRNGVNKRAMESPGQHESDTKKASIYSGSYKHGLVKAYDYNGLNGMSRDKHKNIGSSNKAADNKIIQLPAKLKQILANNYAGFGTAILQHRVEPAGVLKEVDFSNSFMTDWGRLHLPPGITKADLSFNYCSFILPRVFGKNSSLVHLNIRNNFLGSSLAEDWRGQIFRELSKLYYLNIRTNLIYKLPRNLFLGLKSLRLLDISDNKLQTLNISLAQCGDLQFVNVSRNSLGWIDRKVRDDLDHLASHHPVVLDVTLNPLPCTCAGLEVLEWLDSTNVTIISADFLKCRLDNSKIENIGDLSTRVKEIKGMCDSNVFLLTICACASAVALTVLILGLAYRNRWRLIYWKNITISRLFGYRPCGIDKGALVQPHKYDAFIVHTESILDFVRDEMTPELVTKRGHKLCIPSEDFLPGTPTITNIVAAVNQSRVTLLVVTRDFMQDDWAEYSLKMALIDEEYHKRNSVFLLLRLGDIAQAGEDEGDGGDDGEEKCLQPTGCDAEIDQLSHKYEWLTHDLLSVLQRRNFIEFPNYGANGATPEVVQECWDRLSRRIGCAHAAEQPDYVIN